MQEGYIKLSRRISSHWLWTDAERLKWWLDLLLLASWEDSEVFNDGHKILLKAGQLIASVAFLSRRWGRSHPTIIGFLRLLEGENMITRAVLYRQTAIITICKYDSYQMIEKTGIDTLVNTQVYTQVYTNKINEINKENDSIIRNTSITHNTLTKEDEPCQAPSDGKPSDPSLFPSTSPAESGKSEKIDWVGFHNFYNASMKGKLPQIGQLTEKRKAAVRSRIAEYGKESVSKVIAKVVASSFLLGNNDRNWRADFDWIFRPTNFTKILEGNYDNREQPVASPSGKKGSRQFYGSDTEYTDEL